MWLLRRGTGAGRKKRRPSAISFVESLGEYTVLVAYTYCRLFFCQNQRTTGSEKRQKYQREKCLLIAPLFFLAQNNGKSKQIIYNEKERIKKKGG